jgi:hypothetical protein
LVTAVAQTLYDNNKMATKSGHQFPKDYSLQKLQQARHIPQRSGGYFPHGVAKNSRHETQAQESFGDIKLGQGLGVLPMLAANNYDLLDGESSIFARKLQGNNIKNFEVQKRKMKKVGVDFELQHLYVFHSYCGCALVSSHRCLTFGWSLCLQLPSLW